MKNYLLTIILTIGIILSIDYNQYKESTKELPLEENKLLLSITTDDGKSESSPFLLSLGHSWITLSNQLNHAVMVQDYALQPNEEITISVWAISNHYGIVYNLESNFIKEFNRYQNRVSITISIEEEAIEKLNQYIKENNSWTFTHNCSNFSLHLWNTLVQEEYQLKEQTLLYTPARLKKSMQEFKTMETDKPIETGSIFFYEDSQRKELSLCES